MSAPILTDGRVTLRAIQEKDVGTYLRAFAEGDEFLSLLGYDDVPERARIERYFDYNWLEPPELHSSEFAVADATTDEFLGTMTIRAIGIAEVAQTPRRPSLQVAQRDRKQRRVPDQAGRATDGTPREARRSRVMAARGESREEAARVMASGSD